MGRFLSYFAFGIMISVAYFVGEMIGSSSGFSIDIWGLFKDIIAMLFAGIAVYIANEGLNTYKRQHIYTEKFKVWNAFSHQLAEFYSCYLNLRNRTTCLSHYLQFTEAGYKDVAEDWDNQRKAFHSSSYEMQQLIDKHAPMLSTNEYVDVKKLQQALSIEAAHVRAAHDKIRNQIFDNKDTDSVDIPGFVAVHNRFKHYLAQNLSKYLG
ncbi:hypothetical protein MJ923_14210 [Shewanella sp. 3B26]|uniref:Uncharacterized protein n=1 Tax=Shewanella zhuhaiensis TaxID=2919576 RepID=A0AAJ1BKE6_9GAMM|nr:hypothetical protein [Shewanella zhuhaiensis]MCH4295457.1 hypothetical protein [Shewanella zhuhaiensis]